MVNDLMRPLIEQAEELTAAVKQDGVARRKENKRILAVAVALLVLLVLTVAVLLQNRSRSIQSGQILRNSAATSDLIADCTSPGGKCYQESQKRTQGVLAQLVEINKIVAQCAKVTNTDDEMDTCVQARLKALPGKATPAPTAGPTPSTAQDSGVTP
jgi:hypothetical protein